MSDWKPWRAVQYGDDLWDVVDSRGVLVAFGMTEDAVRKLVAAPELAEALEHMRWCRHCGEDSWEDCEGGRQALAALAKARGEG